jgi:hypothetical protein
MFNQPTWTLQEYLTKGFKETNFGHSYLSYKCEIRFKRKPDPARKDRQERMAAIVEQVKKAINFKEMCAIAAKICKEHRQPLRGRVFYHGTTAHGEALAKLRKTGFDLAHCTTNQQMLGNAVYLAPNLSVAQQYTKTRYDSDALAMGTVLDLEINPKRVAEVNFEEWEKKVHGELADRVTQFRNWGIGDAYNREGERDLLPLDIHNQIVRDIFMENGYEAAILPDSARVKEIINGDGGCVAVFNPSIIQIR